MVPWEEEKENNHLVHFLQFLFASWLDSKPDEILGRAIWPASFWAAQLPILCFLGAQHSLSHEAGLWTKLFQPEFSRTWNL